MVELRQLGTSGLATPRLVLGGNVFDFTVRGEEAFAVLDRFIAAGGTMIDTADVYSSWVPGHVGGESERLLGRWLKRRGRRDDVLIATKVGYDKGLGRAHRRGDRRVAGAARHRSCRPLLRPQGRFRHAAPGDAEGVRPAGARRQGARDRRLQLFGRAAGRGARSLRPGGAGGLSRCSSPNIISWPATGSRGRCSSSASSAISACCPISARLGLPHRQVPLGRRFREERPRRPDGPLSRRNAAGACSPRSTRWRRKPRRDAGAGGAALLAAQPRRHRADRQRDQASSSSRSCSAC